LLMFTLLGNDIGNDILQSSKRVRTRHVLGVFMGLVL